MAFIPALIGAVLPSVISMIQNRSKSKDKFNPVSSGSSSMGAPKGYETFSTFSPQQEKVFNQLLSQLGGQGQGEFAKQGQNYLQGILGGDTSKFEAPLMRQFQEQIVPGLAERFSGAGAGAQSSSAFQQALGGAGADLAERLGSLRGQLQLGAAKTGIGQGQQNIGNLLNLLGTNTRGFVPKQKGFWESAAPGLLGSGIQALGSAAQGYFSRPAEPKDSDIDWGALIRAIGAR